MRGKWIVVAAVALGGCGAAERRSEGRATQAEIDNSAQATIAPPVVPTPTAGATPTPVASASDTPVDTARYLGRWTGVEGMFLVVAPSPDGVTLDMQYDLDHRATFAGTVGADGIAFIRGGIAETLRPGDGAATGLKWLADKRDCLVVRTGEGYCRD